MIQDKSILVTGAAGFVGSNLVKYLLNAGNRVRAMLVPGEDSHRLEGLKMERFLADLTQRQSLDEAVRDVDYVFHLGAQLGGNDRDLFYRVNVKGTQNLVQACLKTATPRDRFVFASSTAALGPSGPRKILDHEAPYRPISHYGRSKQYAEEYLAKLKEKLPYTIVRFPLIYGPASRGGFFSLFALAEKHLAPWFGQGESNVCYIEDGVRGLCEAAEHPKTVHKTYILGEKKIYKASEIQKFVGQCVGKWRFPLFLPYPLMYTAGFICETLLKPFGGEDIMTRDAARSYLKHRYWRFDTSLAEKEFSFRPLVPLEAGIEKTYLWYREKGYL